MTDAELKAVADRLWYDTFEALEPDDRRSVLFWLAYDRFCELCGWPIEPASGAIAAMTSEEEVFHRDVRNVILSDIGSSKINPMTDDLVERLRRFADAEDSGGCCDLQLLISPSREAADEIERLRDALELSSGRWEDLASVIDERGSYDNAGFCRASAARCRNPHWSR